MNFYRTLFIEYVEHFLDKNKKKAEQTDDKNY